MTTATRHGDLQHPDRTQPTAKSRIGLIVALSMAAGLIAAVLLLAMPFIPARENVLTGVVLLGCARMRCFQCFERTRSPIRSWHGSVSFDTSIWRIDSSPTTRVPGPPG